VVHPVALRAGRTGGAGPLLVARGDGNVNSAHGGGVAAFWHGFWLSRACELKHKVQSTTRSGRSLWGYHDQGQTVRRPAVTMSRQGSRSHRKKTDPRPVVGACRPTVSDLGMTGTEGQGWRCMGACVAGTVHFDLSPFRSFITPIRQARAHPRSRFDVEASARRGGPRFRSLD